MPFVNTYLSDRKAPHRTKCCCASVLRRACRYSLRQSLVWSSSGRLSAIQRKLGAVSFAPRKTGSQREIPANPYNEYSFALSDRGDQFYLKSSTDPTGARTFVWGTAVRNSDGTITYADQGAAQGSFDTLNNTINVSVSVSQLNSKVTHGPAIGHKTVLTGLRGSTFTASSTGKRDITRGGTQYVIP